MLVLKWIFFSDNDIKRLQKEYQQYEEELKRLENAEIDIEKQKKPEKQDFEKAKRRAERKAKEIPYVASADQYKRILASGIASVSSLNEYRTISANSMEELNQKLSDFVGADGKYMPFTKSVTLYLPEKRLEGLEIVDTPGINDPVQSRGKRTEELLSQCDVVLMVSPTGQFLSEQDMTLMSTMTVSKAIQHVYLVASQCDNQLFGGEYRNKTIQEILASIRTALGKHAEDTLSQEKQKFPEMGAVFDEFCQNELILTSGACYGLAKYLQQPEKWDDTQQHVYKLLSEKFPQEFSTPEKSLSTLKSLSNTDRIEKIFDSVSQKKTEIIEGKIIRYQQAQSKALDEMLEDLQNTLQNKQDELKGTDINQLEEEKEHFNQLKSQISNFVSSTYRDYAKTLETNLKSTLTKTLQQQMNKFVEGETQTGYKEKTESYEVKVGERSTSKWYNPFSWGSTKAIYETRYRTVRDSYSYVNASPIRRSIETILENLNKRLVEKNHSFMQEANKNLNKELREKLYTLDKVNFNPKRIKDTLDRVLSKLPKAEFEIDSDLPSHLDKYNELKGDECEEFLQDAKEYIEELEDNTQDQIDDYIQDLARKLNKVDLSKAFISTYEEKLEKLKHDLANAEERSKELQKMRDELTKI